MPASSCRRTLPLLGAFLVLSLLGACATSAPAPKPKTAAPVAAGSTEPIRFGELAVSSMRRGMEIGRYIWDIDCAPPYDSVYWTSGWNLRRGSTFDERFDEVLTDAGFDVVGRLGGPDLPAGGMGGGVGRAAFIIQGDLRDVRVELCNRTNWLTGAKTGVSGSGSAKVDWTVYEARSGRLIHKVTTSGTAALDRGVPQGDILLIEEAFADAAERLAGDARFRAVVARGGAAVAPLSAPVPAILPQPVAAAPAAARPVALTAAAEAAPATLPAAPPAALPAAPPVPPPAALQPAAAGPVLRGGAGAGVADATIRVGEGFGLVIGEVDGQSVLLTPAAGGESTVAVHPARGIALTGTVTGQDPVSGLSLVRVPAHLSSALALRGTTAQISEPVSLPAGRGKARRDGIVGAVRPDPRTGFAVIQADLPGLTGDALPAPGDPLIDAGGALLGVALGTRQAGAPPGLVAFHPVGEVLDRLGTATVQVPSASLPRRSWSAAPSLRQPAMSAPGQGGEPSF